MTLRDEVAGRNFRCPGCSCILAAPTAAELGIQPPSPPKPRIQTPPRVQHGGRPATPQEPPRPRSSVRKSVRSEPIVTDPLYSIRPEELVSRGQEIYVEKPGVPDREERERLAEEDYQVQLRVYQAGVNEAAIFQIGFAVITAFLCSLIYYGDKAPADPKRHELFFEWGINIAVLMAAMGAVTFVGFRPFRSSSRSYWESSRL